MTKITVNREALDRWHEALKSLDPHIQQLAVNALRATAAQPEQQAEPVAIPDCGEAGHADGACGTSECLPSFRRKTTPPAAQRPWAGLTDEEFLEACQLAERGNYLVAFQRIQAKLKEKNNA